jgi:hypothetical protein
MSLTSVSTEYLTLMVGFTVMVYFGICGLVQALEDRQMRTYPDSGR